MENNQTKEKIMTSQEISDDVQQTFENVTDSYKNLLKERIDKLMYKTFQAKTVIDFFIEKMFPNKLYSNKIIPIKGNTYFVIVQLDKEWEVIETKGTYKNEGWFSEDGKQLIKVIAWKEI